MQTLLAFFLTLGILITFHELGHYWVARAFGVEVQRFSIGFGKVLFKRTDKHGTEWAISAIPLGGYVKMLESPEPEGGPDQHLKAFKCKPVGARFAIVAAGPVFNLILAVVLYAAINVVGVQEPQAILALPQEGAPAALAGIIAGDKVVTVDEVPVESWGQFRYQLLRRLTDGGKLELTIDRSGVRSTKILTLTATSDFSNTDPLRDAGLRLWSGKPVVNKVIAGGAGEQAGFKAGDVVVSAGTLIHPDVAELIALIQTQSGKRLSLKIERQNELLTLEVTPRAQTLETGEVVGRIDVQLGGNPALVDIHYGFFASVAKAVDRTFDTAFFTLQMMGKMLLGEVSWRNISGPVTIADYAGQTAKLGFSAYISFLALVSISLGVLNLLPIPMLDGGHLLYYLIEMIKGSPVSERWMEVGQKAGMGLLACLMVLAMFNDLVRLFT